MKILITGSKGMLGQYMAQVFSQYDLTLWDREDLDITNQEEVNTKIVQLKPEIIINCAAYNNVDGAESEAEMANLLNGYAVGYLAGAAKRVDAIMVHFSTGYVFKGDKQDGYTEDDKPDPQNVYAKSKLLGEKELQKNSDKFYLIRTSRIFGKQGIGEWAKLPFTDLIVEMAEKNDYKVKAVDEEYDLPTYGLDLARAVESLITKGAKPPIGGLAPYGIYHISNSGEPCTWYGFASEIFKIKKMDVEIEPVSGDAFGARAAMRPMYAGMKNTKLAELRDWREALGEYLG